MNVTLKTKAVEKQHLLKKAMHLKFISGAVSKQIKDCFEPIIPSKNLIILSHKNKRSQLHKQKISMQTTTSSLSTRHQSAQKYRKIHIKNPQISTVLKQNLADLNERNNGYTIKWRNPTSNITKIMRVILGQWLMQLAHEIQIPKDAIYNALHYTDKYVGMVNVPKAKYQSIGLCALFIASKLQLSNHPNIDIFVQAMDGSITKSQLIQLQQNMVFKLKFKLNPPTLYQYMVLLISLFNHYGSKNYQPFVHIVPNTWIYMELFWILDGIHLDNQYKIFHNKQKVCLSILYIVCKKQKTHNNLLARKKLYQDLQTLKQQTDMQRFFQSFLTNVIQITRKLTQLKECINYYRKWIKFDRVDDTVQEQIQQLKRIILNL